MDLLSASELRYAVHHIRKVQPGVRNPATVLNLKGERNDRAIFYSGALRIVCRSINFRDTYVGGWLYFRKIRWRTNEQADGYSG